MAAIDFKCTHPCVVQVEGLSISKCNVCSKEFTTSELLQKEIKADNSDDMDIEPSCLDFW